MPHSPSAVSVGLWMWAAPPAVHFCAYLPQVEACVFENQSDERKPEGTTSRTRPRTLRGSIRDSESSGSLRKCDVQTADAIMGIGAKVPSARRFR